MRIQCEPSKAVDRWIAERHYLRSTPAGARLRLFIYEGSQIIGAMMWGRPISRLIDQNKILELTRFVMVDSAGKNSESRALALARKYIRTHMPEIKGLLAYSSPDHGHGGTIYAADNWFCMGLTERRRGAKSNWTTRGGRENRDGGRKRKWVRSP